MKKYPLVIFTTVGTLLMLLYQPLFELFQTRNLEQAAKDLGWAALFFLPYLAVYLVNHYFIIPKYIFQEKNNKKFWIVNLLIFFIFYVLKILTRHFFGEYDWIEFVTLLLPNVMVVFMIVGTSLGIRYYLKSVEDMEKEKENQKAELQWLKNQLNPHFLFNTMNNISSQIYTNPDEAQENLSRLSGVLRYALYETAAERVPLSGEVDFMYDYITLMKMRCSEKTKVTVDFPNNIRSEKILPLLYISLIENAFKHGVSNTKDSFVDISLKKNANTLVFCVKNSNFPKKQENRSGSGIGLENLKRRLELAYFGNYTFTYSLISADVFQAQLVLNIEK